MTETPSPQEQDPEPEPASGPESQAPPPQQQRPPRRGVSVLLGIIVGVLFFTALIVLSPLMNLPYFPIPQAVLVIAYVVAAAVLAARPRTAPFGSGLLIAIGVSVLLGAGVCVALLSGIGRS